MTRFPDDPIKKARHRETSGLGDNAGSDLLSHAAPSDREALKKHCPTPRVGNGMVHAHAGVQSKTREPKLAGLRINAGSDLLSHAVAHTVPSAVSGLTSVFGMGTGVTLIL
jgi:hypothetical protein